MKLTKKNKKKEKRKVQDMSGIGGMKNYWSELNAKMLIHDDRFLLTDFFFRSLLTLISYCFFFFFFQMLCSPFHLLSLTFFRMNVYDNTLSIEINFNFLIFWDGHTEKKNEMICDGCRQRILSLFFCAGFRFWSLVKYYHKLSFHKNIRDIFFICKTLGKYMARRELNKNSRKIFFFTQKMSLKKMLHSQQKIDNLYSITAFNVKPDKRHVRINIMCPNIALSSVASCPLMCVTRGALFM